MSFIPTILYIKEHPITGLRYFGKTTKIDKVLSYNGSGKYCRNHLKIHGKENIKTIWISEIFYNIDDIREFSTFFSEEFDIVNSNKWANLIKENGIDGIPCGYKFSEEVKEKHRLKIGSKNPFYNKKHTEETKKLIGDKNRGPNKNRSRNMVGSNNPMYGRKGENNPNYGRKHSEDTLLKLSIKKSGENNPMYGKFGENNPNSIFSNLQKIEIYNKFISGISRKELYIEYKNLCSSSTIKRIIREMENNIL